MILSRTEVCTTIIFERRLLPSIFNLVFDQPFFHHEYFSSPRAADNGGLTWFWDFVCLLLFTGASTSRPFCAQVLGLKAKRHTRGEQNITGITAVALDVNLDGSECYNFPSTPMEMSCRGVLALVRTGFRCMCRTSLSMYSRFSTGDSFICGRMRNPFQMFYHLHRNGMRQRERDMQGGTAMKREYRQEGKIGEKE